MIELLCAVLGLIAAYLFSGYAGFVAALFFWLLVPLAILDWKHLWLPDSLVFILAIIGLVGGGIASGISLPDRLIGGVAGFAVLQTIRVAYQQLRRRDGMGGGDPKLLGAIGLWTGWQALPIIVMLASAIGLAWFLFQRETKSAGAPPLPLGSFLAAAVFLYLIAS